VPFVALKYVLNAENTNRKKPRYEPYGVFITKKYGYENGRRPVLYLSDEEMGQLKIPSKELWRVVRFEVREAGWISWLHEREWRCRGNFALLEEPLRGACAKYQRRQKAAEKPHKYNPLTLQRFRTCSSGFFLVTANAAASMRPLSSRLLHTQVSWKSARYDERKRDRGTSAAIRG